MHDPHPASDGTPTWSQPMNADARGIHMGDITELGNVVAGAFERPEENGAGQVLSLAGDLMSWNDIVGTLRRQGHNLAYSQTSDDPFGMRDMFAYFEEHTYFGPDAASKIALADRASVKPSTDFATWGQDEHACCFLIPVGKRSRASMSAPFSSISHERRMNTVIP